MKCRLLSSENLIGWLLSCRIARPPSPDAWPIPDALETGMAGGAALVPRDPRGSLEDGITTAGKRSDKQSRDKRALPESALCSGPVTGGARDLEQEAYLKYSAGGLGHPWVPIGTNRARICRSYRDHFLRYAVVVGLQEIPLTNRRPLRTLFEIAGPAS